jgi:hypothetical protein
MQFERTMNQAYELVQVPFFNPFVFCFVTIHLQGALHLLFPSF